MKIALLTDGVYPFVLGGMQKHSHDLIHSFCKNNVQIDVFHCLDNCEKSESKLSVFSSEMRQNINFICIKFPGKGRIPGHYLRASREYSKLIYFEIKKNIKSYDFIYVQGFTGWELLLNKQKSWPKIGVHFHGIETHQKTLGLKSYFSKYMLKRAVEKNLKLADCVFSLGGKLTTILESIGISQSSILEIPLGIDKKWIIEESEISSKEQSVKFVFLGRYERRKGVQEINQVVIELLKSEKFEMHFIGPIPDKYKIDSPDVNYHGKIMDRDVLKSLLRTMDVMLCPSISEGMPNVIMEAMALGVAVIASDVGAVSEQVDSSTGWLITPANKGELKDAMINAIHDEKLDLKKKNANHKIREKFVWDTITTQTILKLSEIIDKNK